MRALARLGAASKTKQSSLKIRRLRLLLLLLLPAHLCIAAVGVPMLMLPPGVLAAPDMARKLPASGPCLP